MKTIKLFIFTIFISLLAMKSSFAVFPVYVPIPSANKIQLFYSNDQLHDLLPAGEINSVENPKELALSPDGKRLYVVSGSKNLVAVIDTSDLKKIGEIPTETPPTAVGVSFDNKKLYVATLGKEALCKGASSPVAIVSSFNVESDQNQKLKDFPLCDPSVMGTAKPYGENPHGVFSNPDGKRIYILTKTGMFGIGNDSDLRLIYPKNIVGLTIVNNHFYTISPNEAADKPAVLDIFEEKNSFPSIIVTKSFTLDLGAQSPFIPMNIAVSQNEAIAYILASSGFIVIKPEIFVIDLIKNKLIKVPEVSCGKNERGTVALTPTGLPITLYPDNDKLCIFNPDGTFNTDLKLAEKSFSPHGNFIGAEQSLPHEVSFSPQKLDFPDQPIGKPSEAQTIILTNKNLPADFTGMKVSSEFNVTSNCRIQDKLLIGQQCSFQITFNPTSEGPKTGSLDLTFESSFGIATVSIVVSIPVNGKGTPNLGTSSSPGSSGCALQPATSFQGLFFLLASIPLIGYWRLKRIKS